MPYAMFVELFPRFTYVDPNNHNVRKGQQNENAEQKLTGSITEMLKKYPRLVIVEQL